LNSELDDYEEYIYSARKVDNYDYNDNF